MVSQALSIKVPTIDARDPKAPLSDPEWRAWVLPLVLQMRDRLRRIELSVFWKLRNRFFLVRRRLGMTSDGPWNTFELPPFYSALLETDDRYAQWRVRNDPRPADLYRMSEICDVLAVRPVFELVIVGDDAERSLREQTLYSFEQQAYPDWTCESQKDQSADFVVFVFAGDRLAPDALFSMALEAARSAQVDVIYADEDSQDALGRRFAPEFKSSWSPEALMSRDYIGLAVAYRKSLLGAEGVSLRTEFGSAARFDLNLRATERARSIAHVPRILYHRDSRRPHASEDPNYARDASAAIADALQRRGERAVVESLGPRSFAVRYDLSAPGKVSIVIPSRDHAADLDRCLSSVFENTTYHDFEVILIDNGTRDEAALETISRWRSKEPRLLVERMDVPFNYSLLNNAAARLVTGEYLVLLNNDTEVVSPDWLQSMMAYAQRPSIGAVGAYLRYPDGSVQHAGVHLGIGGVAGHGHRGQSSDQSGYLDGLCSVENYSAVTGACLMVRADTYAQIDGLDEAFTVAFNDVDFCLRLKARGYRNVWLPYVVLVHGESVSRGHDLGLEKTRRSIAEQQMMLKRWGSLIVDDPYYNRNLSRTDESMGIRIDDELRA